MAPSPFFRTDAPPGPQADRLSEAPYVLETGVTYLPAPLAPSSPLSRFSPASLVAQARAAVARIPQSWLGMSGYLATGVALGLVLILLVSFLGGDAPRKTRIPAVTDETVHLHAKDIGNTCWRGAPDPSVSRLTVALEIGLDGKVRSAQATGGSPVMRGCVETHVKAWTFLPQAQSSQMVLPFEVDAR